MICYWCLKKAFEAEYVKKFIGMLKQTINIWIIMIEESYYHISCI